MARPGDRGDQPDLGPNQNYPPAGQPQFPPAQYPYHPSEYPSLDQDLNMADTYGQPVQPSIVTQLQEAAGVAPRNGDVNSMSVNTNGASSAGMAPPQTPHQASFSPGGQRESVDETPDTVEAGGSKRKRSKVSRACDECRRKKVKCDAADLDGSLKTCTNCSKAGLTCDYSRVPMKRGPSKGYIKELSDRVQQVETLQAVLAGPGYRPSLDGGTMAESLYSPDDPMSLKRNFSFSDARNPFTASEFQRDRIPSIGGAWTNSPTSAGFRPRDRGSMAIAPDQALATASYPTASIPYWAATASEPRPAKRQKTHSAQSSSLKIEANRLDNYYETVHSELPLLPDLDSTLNILQGSSSPFQCFFVTSIELIPASGRNSKQSDDVDRAVLESFPSGDSVWQFFSTRTQQLPSKRSAEENLLFVWACILLAIHSEYKMRGILGGPSARSAFIKQAMDLISFLQKGDADGSKEGRAATSTDAEAFARLVDRARTVAIMLAKYHALGTAGTEWVMLDTYNISFVDAQAMPHSADFLASLSNIMSQVILEVQNLSQPQNPLNIQMKSIIMNQLHGCISLASGMSRDSPICRQASLFFELVLSRYHFVPTAASVLAPAAQLAEELSQATDPASTGPAAYKPLDVHMFTLVTITLLEVLSSVPDSGLLAIAEHALNTILPLLERKVEQYHNYKSRLEKDEKWYEADEEGAGDEKSWMEILYKHIQERKKVGWINAANANGGGSVGTGGNLTVAFDLLLRTGYLKVLQNLA